MVFNAPMSADRATSLVGWAASESPRHVLDLGCGWAQMLLDVVAACRGATGTGVDNDPALIQQAREKAATREIADRVTLTCGDAARPDDAGGQPSDLVVCIGAGHIWGSDADALAALRRLVRPGGRVLFGAGIWSRPPTQAACVPFGGDPKTFRSLAELVDLAAASGLRTAFAAEASLEEWDAFESAYLDRFERWLRSHDREHPHAQAVRDHVDQRRRQYLAGYRGVLGFAYLGLYAS